MNEISREKSILIILISMSLFFLGLSMSAKAEEAADPIVGPHEFIPYGHFDDIELDENNFPAGQRLIGHNQGEVYVDDTHARSGTHSLYIEGTGGHQANGFGVLQQLVASIPAGETYQFTVWYRAPEALAAGDGRGIYARIQASTNIRPWQAEWIEPLQPGSQYGFTISSGSGHLLYVRADASARQDPNDPTDWHPLSVTFTLPEDVGTSNFIINIYNESTHPVWIDDLSLEML